MNYSFVMGINDIKELKENGFEIKSYGENYGVIFSDEQINLFEKFIYKSLQNGFWNEYLGKEKVFIFKFDNGDIKKYILNEENEDEVLKFCREFADYNFENIDKMLKNNIFYFENYFNKL